MKWKFFKCDTAENREGKTGCLSQGWVQKSMCDVAGKMRSFWS